MKQSLVARRYAENPRRVHHQGETAMNCYRNVTASTVALLGIALLPDNGMAQQKSLKEQLVGAWTIVSNDNTTPDGKKEQIFGANPKGILIFDASGQFA